MATNPVVKNGMDSGLVVHIPPELVDEPEVLSFLDYLFLKRIEQRSALTEEAAAELADQVDRAAWERVRPMVEEKLRGR